MTIENHIFLNILETEQFYKKLLEFVFFFFT